MKNQLALVGKPSDVQLFEFALACFVHGKAQKGVDSLPGEALVPSEVEGVDPVGINGSYAGAMGIAQFMPSNIITLAQDGNQDGRIDLFTHDDAIASIANYLKHYGWYPGIDGEKAYKVLYRYNHSKYYVDTLLKIAGLLKS